MLTGFYNEVACSYVLYMSIHVHTVHSLDVCSVPLVGMSVLDCSIYNYVGCLPHTLPADIQ